MFPKVGEASSYLSETSPTSNQMHLSPLLLLGQYSVVCFVLNPETLPNRCTEPAGQPEAKDAALGVTPSAVQPAILCAPAPYR